MKNTKIFLLALLVSFFSCIQDDTSVDDSTDDMDDVGQIEMNEFDPAFIENYGATIEKDIMVTVVDTNNNPLSGVIVEATNADQTTDENGIAILRDASIYERFGYIKASLPGFIHASRSFAPTPGLNQVKIMMLPETVTGTTASGTSTTISNGAGASVELNGNYIKPDGTEYSGSVDVILHHLDPTDEEMRNQMPGMLYAQDQDGEEQGLITLGMLAVELRGDNGEDLNLMAGSKATITVPVDPSLMEYAPETIPLWYFDEENGVWIEEGEATLVGNEYIGEVSHFTFWNCDIPTDADVICLVLSDQDDNPLSNTLVTITSSAFGTRAGITNNFGEVCGLMPSNEVLEFNVYSYNNCGNSSLFNTSIGPFTTDTTLPITVTLSNVIETEVVTGTLSDCNATPISNGYVIVDYLGGVTSVAVEADGSFGLTLLRCATDLDFTVKGVDINNIQQSTIQTYSFTTPLTNIGNLLACDTVPEFIEFNIDNGAITFFNTEDINAVFYPPNANSPHPSLNINSYNPTTNLGIYMNGRLLPDPYVGVYDSLDWNDANDLGFDMSEFMGGMYNDTMEYNLTALGNTGEYIDITFNGTYEDASGTLHTLNGTVHAIRDN